MNVLGRTKTKVNINDLVRYEMKCKVCNSRFKTLIEQMYNEGLNPRQIFEFLKNQKDPVERTFFEKEDLKEATIRRHLNRHYNIKAAAKMHVSATRSRIQQSRENFRTGVAMRVDSIATLSHLIDVALINIEELDNFPDGRQRHQLTINYMAQIKSLIDEFSKLTGELKQEGTLDVNFFSAQITDFAQIVMATISKMDEQFGLNSKLMYAFGEEFKKQFTRYQETQKKMISGELPLNYGEKERSINTFNDASMIDMPSGTTYQKPTEEILAEVDKTIAGDDVSFSDESNE